jgi:outer membrane receptor protein involved in Fe transport
LGDHAQTSYSIDNQPISDQQSKTFSTQLPPSAVQSLEVITGATPAEYGDKTSLVVNAITKSGLNQKKPTGNVSTTYGTFGTCARWVR